MTDAARAFVLEHTQLKSPPLLPELRLHLAGEVMPIWRRLESEAGHDLSPPYWAFAWAGGQALARYILDSPQLARDRSAIDFGAGSGVCAIAAMKAGARSATAVDIDPLCRAAVGLNARANAVEVAFRPSPRGLAGDLLLAGDLFYERGLAAVALEWLRIAARGGATVLIGDAGRDHFPPAGFTQVAEYEVADTREIEERDTKTGAVFTMRDPG